MVRLLMPKLISIEEWLQTHPELKERGLVALFPTLVETDREDKRLWLQSVLKEGHNGSTKPLADHVTFLTSGDALIIMKSADAAKAIEAKSPMYKVGSEVLFEGWSENLRNRLRYRGAFNRVVEMEEVEY